MPLCLAVHLDLGSTPVDKVGFAAQSTEGLTVNFLKSEFKCILIANVLNGTLLDVLQMHYLHLCYLLP